MKEVKMSMPAVLHGSPWHHGHQDEQPAEPAIAYSDDDIDDDFEVHR